MVALARISHDLESMHQLVSQLLEGARYSRTTRLLVETLAEEASGFIRHLLHAGVPDQVDLLADAAADLLSYAEARRIDSPALADAKAQLRRSCVQMRASGGIDRAPITHIIDLGRAAARMPRLSRCSQAHLEVLAAPISRLLLHLFG
jgi:hypothetical protein